MLVLLRSLKGVKAIPTNHKEECGGWWVFIEIAQDVIVVEGKKGK